MSTSLDKFRAYFACAPDWRNEYTGALALPWRSSVCRVSLRRWEEIFTYSSRRAGAMVPRPELEWSRYQRVTREGGQ